MPNLVDTVSNIQKFLNVLTWKKIIQLLTFMLIIGLTWATYENREVIYGFASQKRIDATSPHVTELSTPTIQAIKIVADKSENIEAIQVILADFQKNERIIIYTYIEEEEKVLRDIWLKYSSGSVGNMALFTDNVADNKVVVDLINGEFICRLYSETINARLAPESAKYVKFTCANGIPASYGRFTGIILLYLKYQPTIEEHDQLKSATRILSTHIFENDLNRR